MSSMTNWIKLMLQSIKGSNKELDSQPPPESPGRETATRYTLTKDWQELRKKIDWMSAPYMAEYVNGLVSERSLSNGGHWSLYARNKYVQPLADQHDGILQMVSLACGSGHIEESLIKEFGWPITEFLGLEYDDQLRATAEERFSHISGCQSRFEFYDFNAEAYPQQEFDIIFTCHSIHHATDIERLLANMNRMLKHDGLIIGIDYFGPTRFQIEFDVLTIIKELFSLLPPELRQDLRSEEMKVQDSFDYDTIETVRNHDLSESVRSSDLRTLLFSTFPVIEIKPMGGTLLRWLLQNRAGNFDPQNPDHVAIVRLLQFVERELIALRRIKSDDLFFVLGKSNRINSSGSTPENGG